MSEKKKFQKGNVTKILKNVTRFNGESRALGNIPFFPDFLPEKRLFLILLSLCVILSFPERTCQKFSSKYCF